MTSEADKRREECQKQAKICQSKFIVPTLSSREWLQQQAETDEKGTWIMVDVRTEPERRVSMIKGAQTLAEFHQDWRAGNVPTNARVAFYCTIGYRSGIQATKYLRQNAGDLDGRVFNLDGVVAFSQAVVDQISLSTNTDNPRAWLIEPSSGEPATLVHTFGMLWNFVDTDVYSATSYSTPALLARMLQVGGITAGHYLREGFYFLKSRASRRKHSHKQS